MSWRIVTGILTLLASANMMAMEPRATKIGMATPADAVDNGIYVWIKTFSDSLKESGMDIQIYPNGILGGDKERIEQMALDLLEVNVTNPDEISRLSPTFYGIAPPFMFESYPHMDRFLEDSPFLAEVNQQLAPHGLRIIDFAYTGAMVGLLTRDIPVRNLTELQSIRLRFLSAPDLKLFAAWNVRGVQVSWSEVAHALATGMVDGYLNPPAVATMFGHGSVLDYFTDLRMGPSARLIVASTAWYENLTRNEQQAFQVASSKARAANREWNSVYIAKERAALEKVGIEWIIPTEAARSEWAEHTVDFMSPKWEDPEKTALVRKWINNTRKDPDD